MLPTRIILHSRKQITKQAKQNKTTQPNSNGSYFYLKGQLFPFVKQDIEQCELLTEQPYRQQKIILVNQNFSVQGFQDILGFLHGGDLEIDNMEQLGEYLNIFDFLRARIYIDQIQSMIEQDIQSYEVFCLLQLAYNYGMQRIFDLCLRYLQFDQFQQIKYNKFDFLSCNFKLFQIVLRRHHVLKMKGQIQGIDVADIQQVIQIYCHRNRIDQESYDRLIKKYVEYFNNFEKVKNSLRLDKLVHKNILQSANIDSDFYQNHEGIIHFQQLKQRPQKTIYSSRKRKYSAQIKKQVLKNIMKFSNNKDDCAEKEEADAQSILQDQSQGGQQNYQIKIKNAMQNVGDQSNLNINGNPQGQRQDKNCQEPQSIASKISGILNQYKQALNQHDKKYNNIRKNAQSTFFQSFRGVDVESNPRVLNSFKLENQKGLFAIYEPIA